MMSAKNKKILKLVSKNSKKMCSMPVISNQDDESESKMSELNAKCNTYDAGPLMRNLFATQLYTDVTFFSNSSKSVISAHRAVLASKSDFFNDLLFGEQKYEANGMEMQVQISNVPFCIFKNIVKYFYTNDIEFPDDSTVIEIYAAAQSFCIRDLIDKCKIYVESMGLTEDNVCSILQVCNARNVEELKSRCISFIEKNTLSVVRSTDFEKCSFSTVREICELQNVSLNSESELLEAILHWLNVQPSHVKKDLSKSLIKCIQFLSFTPREFSDFLQKQADFLVPEDGLKILMYLNNPTPESLKSLPKWCNRNQRSFCLKKETLEYWDEQQSEVGRIKISLKPTDKPLDILQLTNLLHLKCLKGMHEIKSINFSFEVNKDSKMEKQDGRFVASFVIGVKVVPNGPTFRKNYVARSTNSTFLFTRTVKVSRGQMVEIEIAAQVSQTGRFLQFHRWHNDAKKDFQIFLFSKPKQGNLNCISEILYDTLPSQPSASSDKD